MARTRSILSLLAFVLTLSIRAAEFRPTESEVSNQRALAIVTRALAAHGGAPLEKNAVSFSFEGTHTIPLQNRTPDITRDPLPKRGAVLIVPRGDRVTYEEHIGRAGVYTGRHRYLLDGDKGANINLRSPAWRPAGAASILQRALMLAPHALLQDALRRAHTIRLAGEEGSGAARRERVSFHSSSTQVVTLTVDVSGQVVTAETLALYPMLGERSWQHEYRDYVVVDGIRLPRSRVTRLSGLVTETLTFSDFRLAAVPPATDFAPPAGLPMIDDGAGRGEVKESVDEIGKGVFAVRNIGGTDATLLVVEFPDFLVVAGAPEGASDKALTTIETRWPGVPVLYVVPTHHHWDHAAGFRSFVARGAAVMTTPGNETLFRRAAVAPYLTRPDALARKPAPLALELIRGKRRVIEAGEQRLELLDIGPTPHAEEMVVAWVPASGVLFQADLLELDDADPINSATANSVTPVFLERIVALGLPVKIIVGAEGRSATLEELRTAVRLRDPKYD